MKKITAILVLASGFLLAAKPATATPGVLFLKLPGITGPATAAGHEGDIELFSFSAGVSAKKGAGSSCSDLTGMKLVDQTSPLLFATTLAGVDFAHATLTFSQPVGGALVDVFTIVLNNVSITSVQDSGSNETPVESVSLHATSWVTTFAPLGGTPPPVTTTVICK